MIAAGFGGAEINTFHSTSEGLLDPKGHGWGSKPWVDGVQAAYVHASTRDFQLDMAIGPAWPAALPGITPDDDVAAKELVHGIAVVSPGAKFEGPPPPPYQRPNPGVNVQKLLTVQAWKVNLPPNFPNSTSGSSSWIPLPMVQYLDESSVKDLTDVVNDKGLLWVPPPGNQVWVIIAYWERGTGQIPEASPHTVPPSYVIDHFSDAGLHAVTNYWDNHILNDDLRNLMRANHGSMFEDSLELQASTFWTPELMVEFRKRKGYELTSILPVLIRQWFFPVFTFTDEDKARGAINDYWDVLSELYIQEHLGPMKKWAHGELNMTLRAQPYGLQTEAMAAAAILDIPEGESLTFFNNMDNYRAIASAGHFTGKPIISSEAAALPNGAYSTTFNDVLKILTPAFSAGINQHVLHGFSYTGPVPGTSWPGFAAFSPMLGGLSPGFAESWGPPLPQWKHMPDLAAYFARVQWFNRRGTPKYDVGFFTQKGFIGSGRGAPWLSRRGVKKGWNFGFVSPTLLTMPQATLRDGILAPDGPGYRALLVDGDPFSNGAHVLTSGSLRKINEFAKKGLPVLVVGDWSNITTYGYAERLEAKQSEVTSSMTELLRLKSVKSVSGWQEVEAGLKALGIGPSVEYSNDSTLLYHHRVEADMDHFLFVGNGDKDLVDHDVILPSRRPNTAIYEFDPWSGSIQQAASYSIERDGRLRYRIKLKPGQIKMLTLAATNSRTSFIAYTSAPDTMRINNSLFIKTSGPGWFLTTLNNGTTIPSTIWTVPQTITLQTWNLNITSYEPGATPTETILEHYSTTLTSPLKPWSLLPGLSSVSGIGLYTTSFTWPPPLFANAGAAGPSIGATLNIPKFEGSFRLRLNNKRVPSVDQLDENFDLGRLLRDGSNDLEIEVTSTLLNRLKSVNGTAFWSVWAQEYGLKGVLKVVPYVLVEVGPG
jgi:hypothetical protein